MNLSFHKLSVDDAKSIVQWRYDGPYSVYDTPVDQRQAVTEYLLDPLKSFFSVYRSDELVGFFSVGSDGQVDGGNYDASAIDLGAGMRPDLVGKGEGASFLRDVVVFAQSITRKIALRATIATWNQRALRCAHANGFVDQSSFTDSKGREFVILLRPLTDVN